MINNKIPNYKCKKIFLVKFCICFVILFTILCAMGKYGISAKANVTYADVEQFPESYRDKLYAIKEKHPNWTFVKYDTGLEWDTVLYNETNPAERSLIPSYFPSNYVSDYYGDGWSCATPEAVVYYMDPRNWLTEDYIFQFELLTYNEECQGIATVQKVLANSFMSGLIEGYDSITYAQAFHDIGALYNVSPVHLAARVYQEQGVSGTSELISGTYPGFEGYYNYYNIQATGSTREEIVKNGLNEAKSEGWNSRYVALRDGSLKLANRYILRGQDTLYLQKYDVDGQYDGRYWHQYMQNICAPSNEGRNVKKAYERAGMLDCAFVFKIPVFSNMPYDNGFYENENGTYYYVNAVKYTGIIEIDGYYYCFDENGLMIKDMIITIKGKEYYYDEKGHRLNGVAYKDGYWYVSDADSGVITDKIYAGDILNTEEYLMYNPDLANTIGNNREALVQHWLNYGIYEGRRPSIFYDNSYYTSAHRTELEKLGISKPEDVAGHFVAYGMQALYAGSRDFSPAAYAMCNGDLRIVCGNDYNAYYRHYRNFGMHEGRRHSLEDAAYDPFQTDSTLFTPQAYAKYNPDVAAALGTDENALFRHWLEYGIYEGRQSSEVYDGRVYLNENPDVAEGYRNSYAEAVLHFDVYGMNEGRVSGSNFDILSYAVLNPDILMAYKLEAKAYYAHYANYGCDEGRVSTYTSLQPVIDMDYYLKNNPDVASIYNDRVMTVLHFMSFGIFEGRQGSENFDVYAYMNLNDDLRAEYGDNLLGYYMHYVRFGYTEGRKCKY